MINRQTKTETSFTISNLKRNNTTPFLLLALLIAITGLLIPAVAQAETKESLVIISDFSTSPQRIEAGEDFSATVILENISNQQADNVRISINAGAVNSPFAPYLTPGTIMVEDRLLPGEQTIKTFRLGSTKKAEPGINNLFITVRHQTVAGSVYQEHNSTDTIGIFIKEPPEEEIEKPKLTISQTELNPKSIEAGQEFSMQLEIKNIGEQKAQDISVSVSRLEDKTGLDIFFPVDGSNVFTIDELRSNRQAKETLKFKVSPHAQAKTHNLIVEITYRDEEGKAYTTTETISIPVYKQGRTFIAETGPKLIIKGQRTSQTPVAAGESFDLILDILNAADFTAKNIKITLEEEAGNLKNFSPIKTGNVIFIPQLTAQEQITRNISLVAARDIEESKRYNLNVKMTCEDDAGNTYESTGIASVLVKGEAQKWGPELTVTSYQLPSEQVESGNDFILTLNVRNIGDEPAKNAKISLNGLEDTDKLGIFSPLQTSNTLHIEKLAAGETAAKSIKLFISGEAKSQIYNMVINLEYQGNETKHTGSETIGIPVIEDQSLKIVTFDYPEQVMPGEAFNIYTEYINIGQHPVNNLFVTFKGDFTVDYPMYYLGEFEVGSTDIFETTATISEPGEYHGQVLFSYTNSYKQERTITKPVKIVVAELPVAEPEEIPQEEPRDSFWDKLKRFLLALFGLGG